MKVEITFSGVPNSGKRTLLRALTHLLDRGHAPYVVETGDELTLTVDTSRGLQWLRNITGDRPEIQNIDMVRERFEDECG